MRSANDEVALRALGYQIIIRQLSHTQKRNLPSAIEDERATARSVAPPAHNCVSRPVTQRGDEALVPLNARLRPRLLLSAMKIAPDLADLR